MPNFLLDMKQYYKLKLVLTLCLSLGLALAWGQVTVLNYTGAMTSYTVPPGVTTIRIEALGAQGASGQSGLVGGRGARMQGDFTVVPGSTIIVAVGGRGQGQSSGSNGGGGGGSFAVMADPGGAYTIGVGPFAGTVVRPLVVAGGGGGTRASAGASGNPGVIGAMGTSSSASSSVGGGSPITGATLGGIAASSSWGSGGAGFVGNGGNDGSFGCGGRSFINGAAGGAACGSSGAEAAGGFGGGGQGRGSWGGGGGGGWAGGQGGFVAGGGGSVNNGVAQVNASGFRDGDGQVTIQVLCIGLVPTIPVTGVCIGETLTLSAASVTGGSITWSGGVINGVPFAPPLGTTNYVASSSSPLDCGFNIDISASEIPDIEAFSSLPAACEGAIITLWGEGGDTYTWSGTGDITPIDSVGFLAEPGTVTYTLIGSILGCEGPPDMVTLVGSAQPDVIGTATPASVCLGDTYTLTGSGDLAVGFDWGDDIVDGEPVTPESAGTFIHIVIGVSAAGCYDTSSVTVDVYPTPIVTAGLDVAACEGHDVVLNAEGALTYTWVPAITEGVPFPALAGETTYTVTGTDINGCEDEDEIIVTGVELPTVASSIITDEFFGYDGAIDITVTGGSGDYIFDWSNGATSEDITGLTAGVYTVIINDVIINEGQCPSEASFTVSSFVGVDENGKIMFNAYPNPTTDLISVVYQGQFSYQVINLIGEVVTSGTANNQQIISLKDFANGTYVVKVMSGENVGYVQVVKQ
jgi:hypothetical protein